ncbi:Major royal jelly protein 1 [Trachymyrmex cornetzi]|uniref:Major royal jelly protein 1 n=1 Tax=Trachymyrmex cornetzi TaxID=471704 RepID=A0A195E1W5_9HYME|nr:Major royal jelly protein 1 [Trachymyrmex cornetzi]
MVQDFSTQYSLFYPRTKHLAIKCNHLFIVDEDRIGDDQLCLPQLLIFDVSTDKLVKRVTIPFDIAHNKTGIGLLSSIAVFAPIGQNVKDNVRDVEGGGIVVYNGYTSKLCRIDSDFMKSTNEDIVVANHQYPNRNAIYDLYYVPFAGNKMHKTKMSNLIECLPKDITEANKETELAGALGGQTVAITSNKCGIFFSDITKTSIMCADATKEINSKNKELVAYDPKMEFVSGMKIRHDGAASYCLRLGAVVFGASSLVFTGLQIGAEIASGVFRTIIPRVLDRF